MVLHAYNEPTTDEAEIVLMRHPQTASNAEHMFVGRQDAPLSELGCEQRDRAICALVEYAPDRVVSSPLSRCRAIAEPVAEHVGCEIIVDPDAIEIGFGVLEGMSMSEAAEKGLHLPWGDSMDGWPEDGGESLDDFERRTARLANRLAGYGGRTVVVSHGGAIRGVLAALFNLSPDQYWSLVISNVSSAIVHVTDNGLPYLCQLGIEPEEIGKGIGKGNLEP